jgi:hypothetical protein
VRGRGRRDQPWAGEQLAHGLIGQPGIAERLIRALGLKGRSPQYIEPDFGSSISVEDLTQPEFAWLRRARRMQLNIGLNAVAAQFSFGLFGPPSASFGSRPAIAITEAIIVTNGAAGTSLINVGMSSQQGFAIVAGQSGPVDDRTLLAGGVAPFSNFGFQPFNNATPPAINGQIQFIVGAGASFILPVNYVLTGFPHTATPIALQIACNGVNLPLTASIVYRERELLVTEL